ncbi:MAG: hypothetical protein ACI4NE_08950 [Succinivibrio sp.]
MKINCPLIKASALALGAMAVTACASKSTVQFETINENWSQKSVEIGFDYDGNGVPYDESTADVNWNYARAQAESSCRKMDALSPYLLDKESILDGVIVDGKLMKGTVSRHFQCIIPDALLGR